jgi:Tol biopolymer transport system component
VLVGAGLFPDGKRLWFGGSEPEHGLRIYLTDVSGAKPRALTPEGQTRGSLSPDGNYFLITPPAGKARLYPTAGGEPQDVAIGVAERIAGWSRDGQEVFVFNYSGIPAKVYRVNWKTGHRELMREIAPADRAGTDRVDGIEITPDGGTYAYSCVQTLSDLHLVQGLK